MGNEHPQSEAPPSVDWWITSRCNLSCEHCWGPEPDRTERRDLRPQILAAIGASSTPYVTLCGGEPLVVPDLAGVILALARSGKRIVLNTNGELLDDRNAIELGIGSSIQVVGISIDGPDAASHLAMRRGSRFDRTLAAARLVRGMSGARLKLATVMSAVNIDCMRTMGELVSDLKPDVWRIYQYSSRGMGAKNKDRYVIDDERYHAEIAALRLTYPRLPISPSSSIESMCFIVDYKGDVLRPHTSGYDVVANCLERPLDAIWKNEWQLRASVVNNKSWLLPQLA